MSRLPGNRARPVLRGDRCSNAAVLPDYAWQPQHVIPPCWTVHERLTYEIAAFAFARIDAYNDAGSVIVWHEQYERFLTRMNNYLGKAGDDCRAGKHDARPARFALAAWPPTAQAQADAGTAADVELVEKLG